MKTENWKAVYGYFDLYEVSDSGRVRSLDRPNGYRGRILKAQRKQTGYLVVFLCKNGLPREHFIHRLVLESFVGAAPRGNQACHGDGSRDNNRLNNLRWGTCKENQADTALHGRRQIGVDRHNAVLNPRLVRAIRISKERVTWWARKLGISRCAVDKARRRETWAHVV